MTGDRKPYPFLQTEFNETKPQFSPDGRWVVYSSDESGKFEVYVQTFPSSANKWKISTNGGGLPRWRGNEIFFVTPDRKLWSVDVKAGGSTFEAGVPKLLFESRIYQTTSASNNPVPYDVTSDGKRFLITSTPAETSSSDPIIVVLNWLAGFKPAGK